MEWGDCVKGNVPTLECIPVVFNNIVDWAFVLSGIAALSFIIMAGYKFISSGGDPKQVDGAKKTLTMAIVGLVIIAMSYLILNLVAYTTGVGCITKFGFTNCK